MFFINVQQMQEEEEDRIDMAELGLDYRSCRNGCSVFRDPNDPSTELQKVALFLGYVDGRLLETPNEKNFTTRMSNGTCAGNAELVIKMLRDIVKNKPWGAREKLEERKAAVRALKDYQKDLSNTPAPGQSSDASTSTTNDNNNDNDKKRLHDDDGTGNKPTKKPK